MVRNKKTHGKRKLDSPSVITTLSMIANPSTTTTPGTTTTPSTDDIVSTKYADTTISDHTTTPYLPIANAARAVFTTVELFKMVLVHLPTKALSRALSVSKHCRDVILSNQQLRQKLFLEAAQATEYLEHKCVQVAVPGIPETTRVRHEVISKELRQNSWDSRIIVEAHPILEVRSEFESRRYRRPLYSFDLPWHANSHDLVPNFPLMQTMPMSREVVRKLPAQSLLFQPPVTQVTMYHHDSPVLLRCIEGGTFGMVVEQSKKMDAEEDQYFRKQNELISHGFLTLPHIIASCQTCLDIIEALQRSRRVSCAVSCLHFGAEGIISKDSEQVQAARLRMDRAI